MSIKYKEMVRATSLTGTPTSLYAAPSLASAAIHAATAYNPTAGALTVDLYKVPAGLAADATTKIGTRTIPAGALIQIHEAINHKLESGTQIFAAGAGLTLNVSGVEYIPD
jgi:hypothetical protein